MTQSEIKMKLLLPLRLRIEEQKSYDGWFTWKNFFIVDANNLKIAKVFEEPVANDIITILNSM